MPTLLLYYPEKEKRWKIEVQGERFIIGRSREADVCIPHTSISKKHAFVERKAGRYHFRDLGSRNGVYLNDFRMEKGEISDGDEMRLGSIRVTFYGGKPPPASGAQPPVGEPEPPSFEPRLGADDSTLAFPAVEPDPEPETGGAPIHGDGTVFLPAEPVPGASDPVAGGEADPEPAPTSAPEAPPIGSQSARKPLRNRPLERATLAAAGARPPAPSRPGSLAWLAAASLFGVGLGLFLGYLGSRLDDPAPGPAEEITAASAKPDPGGGPPPPEAAPAAVDPAPAPLENPLGPPAALEDRETAKRLAIRLFLDIVGRPPTRSEASSLLPLSHQDLWQQVASSGPRPLSRPEDEIQSIFPRFLGRKARPQEHRTLQALAGGDADHYAFLVGTSRQYASAAHRRRRTEEQLAASLLTDLLDVAPAGEQVRSALEALRDARSQVAEMAKVILNSGESRAGPREGETPEDWIRDAHSRLLLRSPSEEEVRRALARIAGRAGGWREVLLELAAREEYRSY